MSELINTSKRQLIPRWHTSRKVDFIRPITSEELIQREDPALFFIDEKKRLWKKKSSVATAIELYVSLKFANMTSDPEYKRLEKFLLSNKENKVSDVVLSIVSPKLRMLDASNNYTVNKVQIYGIIKKLKKMITLCPHDSLSWCDLAFYYAVLGEQSKAEDSMYVAYNLSSKHPFIARAYSRLLVHFEKHDKAIHILKKTGIVKNHPEILSADIAIRTSFGIGHPDISAARKLISLHSNSPFAISELAASIGTLEIESGSLKKGKILLSTSALSPTENTIAQLKWISQQHGIKVPILNHTMKSLEADAITNYNNKNYSECRDALMTLHRFQPFSEGALIDAGYISIVALDDSKFLCDFSEYFGSDVLKSFMAKNNYIVAMLESGVLEGVEDMLQDLSSMAANDRDVAVLSATKGMYLYYVGKVEAGRKLYKSANSFFKLKKFYFGHALSLLHQGMIEKRLDIHNAKNILEKAKMEAKKVSKSPELLDKIIRELALINIA